MLRQEAEAEADDLDCTGSCVYRCDQMDSMKCEQIKPSHESGYYALWREKALSSRTAKHQRLSRHPCRRTPSYRSHENGLGEGVLSNFLSFRANMSP